MSDSYLPCHAMLRPCRSSQGHGMIGAWHGHSMVSVNQTRPHCVNQMGKTHSKPLAARHGRGTAWARHGNVMLCVNRPLSSSRNRNCTRRSICKTSHLLLTCSRSIIHPGSSELHFNNILLLRCFQVFLEIPCIKETQPAVFFFSRAPTVNFPLV